MAYVDTGPRSARETLLLLHGEPMWGYLYRKMIGPLEAAGFRVIVPDLIGFGRSDKPVDPAAYSYSQHVAWLQAAGRSARPARRHLVRPGLGRAARHAPRRGERESLRAPGALEHRAAEQARARHSQPSSAGAPRARSAEGAARPRLARHRRGRRPHRPGQGARAGARRRAALLPRLARVQPGGARADPVEDRAGLVPAAALEGGARGLRRAVPDAGVRRRARTASRCSCRSPRTTRSATSARRRGTSTGAGRSRCSPCGATTARSRTSISAARSRARSRARSYRGSSTRSSRRATSARKTWGRSSPPRSFRSCAASRLVRPVDVLVVGRVGLEQRLVDVHRHLRQRRPRRRRLLGVVRGEQRAQLGDLRGLARRRGSCCSVGSVSRSKSQASLDARSFTWSFQPSASTTR